MAGEKAIGHQICMFLHKCLMMCNSTNIHMFKNDVNDMFNYMCKNKLIDNLEYMTVEYKWQVILTDTWLYWF